MSCSSCFNGGTPRGCKNKGTCGTDGCNKLNVFDWLSNIQLPNNQKAFDIAEIRFKNNRKDFYRIPKDMSLSIGEYIVTKAKDGYDLGQVSLTGELVRFQMKKKAITEKDPSILPILRKATQSDLDLWKFAREQEDDIQKKAREICLSLDLNMKLSNIEFQGDGTKAVFYYTAEKRVDFRQLIKDLARTFRIKIEMCQIGLRQEASKLGGIGSCGRELCCSTWLTDFRSVSTSAARYQQLSINTEKIFGQCGKLKCCLNYELDSYRNALKQFPRMDTKLITKKGEASCQKRDIFKKHLWYAYKNDWSKWHLLSVESVNAIIKKNKNKEVVEDLESHNPIINLEKDKLFENSSGEEDLNRFDKFSKKRKPRNNSKRKRKNEKK